MTTGNITRGNKYSPYYYNKRWTGGDGKLVESKSNPKYFRKFIVTRPAHVVSVPARSVTFYRSGRPVTVVHPAYTYHVGNRGFYDYVLRYGKTRIKTSWNNYTLNTLLELRTTKGTHPTYGFYPGLGYGLEADVQQWNANDEIKLLGRLAEKVRGHSFNMAVALGEGRETSRMVAHTLYRFTSAVRFIRRGQIDRAVRALGAEPSPKHRGRCLSPKQLKDTNVSSIWLEMQYGWLPLLSDCYEAVRAYSALTAKTRQTRFIVSYAKHWSGTPGTSYYTSYQTEVLSKRVIYEATESLSAPRSLGLVDPLTVAWELQPFSLVADWFIPISSYLEALATIPKLQGRFLVTTRRKKVGRLLGKTNIDWIGCKQWCTRQSITRAVSTSLSVPLPRFNSISDALSPKRILNGIALLHQQVR